MGILFNTYGFIERYKTKSSVSIVTEADKDVTPDENDNTVDYTEEAETDIPDTDDTGDDEAENNSDDDTEPTDYTDEADTPDDQSDDNSDDSDKSDSGNSESEDNTKVDSRNIALIDDMISLYYSLKGTLGKLDNQTQMSMFGNKVIVQVKTNLSELLESVFVYINDNFKKNTYAKNVYMYNAFIEAYKVNIEMLKKIELL